MSNRNDRSNPERRDRVRDSNGDGLAGLMDDVWGEVPQRVPSIGDYLARQRQLRGISRDELCTLTRIPMRSLERLESGAFDTLDDGFVRGFVRTVASALGLDPDDTLARMTHEPDTTVEGFDRFVSIGMIRVGVVAAGLVLALISVGLVRVAVQYLPGQDMSSEIVMRSDPVRALAEEWGASTFDSSHALVEPADSIIASKDDLVLPAAARASDGINRDVLIDAGAVVETHAEARALER